MNRHVVRATLSTVAVGALVFACASPLGDDVVLGADQDAGADAAAAPPILVAPEPEEAGAPVGRPDDDVELTSYCPSSECPDGRTTCPQSRFRCDVNLKTDRAHCGACGAACPNSNLSTVYECVEGGCEYICTTSYGDCDGQRENGCETLLGSNDHCSACGDRCDDPNAPCLRRFNGQFQCGCDPGQTYCPALGKCVDLDSDDNHCGVCGNACDPTGGGQPEYPNMYYGCTAGECNNRKCKVDWGNCDGLLPNGCETNLVTSADCGGCGLACGANEKCRIDPYAEMFGYRKPYCMCPAGMTFCGSCQGDGCRGQCFDLTSDPLNCGACGVACAPPPFFGATGAGVCRFGMCELECYDGFADCNGDLKDYCETNIASDPLNCGACGRTCDTLAGQACVNGECVVEPCKDEPVDGGVAVPQ